ncbi:MAG TPA: hypothetical protein VIH48_03850 [Candidatus Bathyarchaeia archaeon]
MSRGIIHDIVIPIVSKMMVEEGYFTPYRALDIRDENLEEFLEEEMRRHFGVIGANDCQHLKEQLEEAKKNDPHSFEFLIRQLVRKYVKLTVNVRNAEHLKDMESGPPDRFAEMRRRYRQLGYVDETATS